MQVHNVAAASNAALQQDVKTLQEDTEKLQDELTDVLEQFDGVQQEADQVKGEVVDEVGAQLGPCCSCARVSYCSGRLEACCPTAWGMRARCTISRDIGYRQDAASEELLSSSWSSIHAVLHFFIFCCC